MLTKITIINLIELHCKEIYFQMYFFSCDGKEFQHHYTSL